MGKTVPVYSEESKHCEDYPGESCGELESNVKETDSVIVSRTLPLYLSIRYDRLLSLSANTGYVFGGHTRVNYGTTELTGYALQLNAGLAGLGAEFGIAHKSESNFAVINVLVGLGYKFLRDEEQHYFGFSAEVSPAAFSFSLGLYFPVEAKSQTDGVDAVWSAGLGFSFF
jgi:hypothetical protein